MFFVLNPAASWRRIGDAYVVMCGAQVFELKGKAADLLFTVLLPLLAEPLTRPQVEISLKDTPMEAVDDLLSAACSISLVLTRQVADPLVGLSELIHTDLLLGVTSVEEIQSEPMRNLFIDVVGDPAATKMMRGLIDIPGHVNEFQSVETYIGASEDLQAERKSEPSLRLVILIDSSNDVRPALAMNRHCLRLGLRWIPAKLGLTQASLGPLIVPFQSPCFECAALRHAAATEEGQLIYESCTEGQDLYVPERQPFSRAMAAQIFGLLSAEVTLMATPGAQSGLIGRVVTVSHLTLGARYHRLLRLPSCPACAGPALRHPWAKLSVTVDEVVGRSRVESLL